MLTQPSHLYDEWTLTKNVVYPKLYTTIIDLKAWVQEGARASSPRTYIHNLFYASMPCSIYSQFTYLGVNAILYIVS